MFSTVHDLNMKYLLLSLSDKKRVNLEVGFAKLNLHTYLDTTNKTNLNPL